MVKENYNSTFSLALIITILVYVPNLIFYLVQRATYTCILDGSLKRFDTNVCRSRIMFENFRISRFI